MERITSKEKQGFEIRHEDMVRKLAPEGTLLLKKDGFLPLKAPCDIAVYGNGVRKTLTGGTGSGEVNAREITTVEQGLEKAGFTITTKEWLDAYDALYADTRKQWVGQIQKEAREAHMHSMLYAMGKVMPEPEYDLPLNGKGDIAVYVLSRISGEGNDRTKTKGDLYLTDTEKRQILALNGKYKEFVLVLNVGGMIELEEASQVRNILLLGQLGATTGDVLADLLLGKSYPSGKLTMTWADIDSYPSSIGFGDLSDVVYRDGTRVGYRHFLFDKKHVRYPFGFGLSYTEFSHDFGYCFKNNELTLKGTVENSGNNAGKDVVQIYLGNPDRTEIKLIDFKKTKELLPGEKETVSLDIPAESLADFSEEHRGNIIRKGTYTVYEGKSSFELVPIVKIVIGKDTVTEKLCPVDLSATEIRPLEFDYIPSEDASVDSVVMDVSGITAEEHSYAHDSNAMPAKERPSFEDVRSRKASPEDITASLSDEELALLCVGRHKEKTDESAPVTMVGYSGNSVAGSAGETSERLNCLGIPNLTMSDGPAGLRIASEYVIVNGEIKIVTGDIVKDSEFLTEEELSYVKMMMGSPSEEEKNAASYYQYSTSLPIGTIIAQSFNPEIAKACGDIVGEEMSVFGVHLWLSPAMNIQRYPLCGRNFEYYSEDPLVSGRIAAGICLGVQSHKGCGVTLKHFACNNQELNRSVNNSIVGEKALRDIYLKPFEIAVKTANPIALMTANNLINDVHACEKRDLLVYVLRDEWGFDGIVMTDWYVTNANMASMFKGSRWGHANAYACVKGGNDISMPGEENDKDNILEALRDGRMSKRNLQDCAARVIKAALKLGE